MSLLAEGLGPFRARLSPSRLLRFMRDLIRYGAASVGALALDYGVLMVLTKAFRMGYLTAAAIGFLSGLALIYLLSVRYVFEGRRARAPRVEALGFLAMGLAGLALTEVLMRFFVADLGLTLTLAKAATAAFVFMFNFLTRRGLLFKV
jgi:putative flippase GtrA